MSTAQTESLCWSCRNSVPDKYGNGCSWSRDLIPVEGWQADYKKKARFVARDQLSGV